MPVTIFTKATGKYHLHHNSRSPPVKSACTKLHLALKHNDGQIHCASSIYGLSPENLQLKSQRPALWHQDNLPSQNADKESPSRPIGENASVTLSLNFDSPQVLAPQQLPNAHKGAEEDMLAINKQLKDQDCIKAFPMAMSGPA